MRDYLPKEEPQTTLKFCMVKPNQDEVTIYATPIHNGAETNYAIKIQAQGGNASVSLSKKELVQVMQMIQLALKEPNKC